MLFANNMCGHDNPEGGSFRTGCGVELAELVGKRIVGTTMRRYRGGAPETSAASSSAPRTGDVYEVVWTLEGGGYISSVNQSGDGPPEPEQVNCISCEDSGPEWQSFVYRTAAELNQRGAVKRCRCGSYKSGHPGGICNECRGIAAAPPLTRSRSARRKNAPQRGAREHVQRSNLARRCLTAGQYRRQAGRCVVNFGTEVYLEFASQAARPKPRRPITARPSRNSIVSQHIVLAVKRAVEHCIPSSWHGTLIQSRVFRCSCNSSRWSVPQDTAFPHYARRRRMVSGARCDCVCSEAGYPAARGFEDAEGQCGAVGREGAGRFGRCVALLRRRAFAGAGRLERRRVNAGGGPAPNHRSDLHFVLCNSVISSPIWTLESSNVLARSAPFQNTLDRPHPTPVSPTLKHQGEF